MRSRSFMSSEYTQNCLASLLGVEDGSQQRQDGNVGGGDLHGWQVVDVVLEGPLRLATLATKGTERYG